MGWASGTELMQEVIHAVQAEFGDQPASRRRIYLALIRAFVSHDWDTPDECLGMDSEWDEAMYMIDPDWRSLSEQ